MLQLFPLVFLDGHCSDQRGVDPPVTNDELDHIFETDGFFM